MEIRKDMCGNYTLDPATGEDLDFDFDDHSHDGQELHRLMIWSGDRQHHTTIYLDRIQLFSLSVALSNYIDDQLQESSDPYILEDVLDKLKEAQTDATQAR